MTDDNTQDVSGIPANDLMAQLELQRKLKMADALKNAEMPQGQMISGHYVPPSWTQQLANAVGTYKGGKAEKEALNQYGEYAKSQQEKLGKAVETYDKAISPEEIKTMKDNFITQPLQMGANVATSPSYSPTSQSNEQVAQVYPNFNGQAPIQNMQGETSLNQPIESVSYRPRTADEKKQAFYNFANATKNPDLMNKMILAQAENLFKAPESVLGKVDLDKFDPQSINNFIASGSKDYSLLKPIAKPENKSNEQKLFEYEKSQGFVGSFDDFKNKLTPYQTEELKLKKQDIALKAEGKFDDATLDMLADQGLAGDTSVFNGLGRGVQGANNIAALRQRMNQKMKDRGWSGPDIAAKNAEFMGLKAGERTVGVKGANIEMAGNEFLNIVPQAKAASDQISRSGFLPFGKAEIMFNEQTNNPTLSQFAAFNNGLVNTYARAISPTGIPTVEDKRKAHKLLSEAKDQEAYNATVDALAKEIEAAKKAPHQVRESLRGEISPTGGGGGKVVHWNDLQ